MLKTLVNQFLTIKELKEALPEIPENSLKRYLQEHEEYLNFKKEHNRYKIHASDIEKLKLIRRYYSEGCKKEEVNAKLEENGFPVTIIIEEDQSTSIVSMSSELTDMKKLISFLVQQNEQTRIQSNKMKEQNQQLIHEVQQLGELLQNEVKKEAKAVAFLSESLLATQKTVEEVVSSVENEKNRGFWNRLFRK